MEKDWFKAQLRAANKTTSDLADAIARDRAVVSRILNGRQKITFEQAQVFATVLGCDLSEVLSRAGLSDRKTAQTVQPGFADSDAAAWIPAQQDTPSKAIASALGADRAGVDVWQVRSAAMSLQGYLPDDFMLVDSQQSELCKAGDVVIAQIYNWNSGGAKTVLRRFEPPVLVAASTDPEDHCVHVVDGNNVVIRGKVVASWRV